MTMRMTPKSLCHLHSMISWCSSQHDGPLHRTQNTQGKTFQRPIDARLDNELPGARIRRTHSSDLDTQSSPQYHGKPKPTWDSDRREDAPMADSELSATTTTLMHQNRCVRAASEPAFDRTTTALQRPAMLVATTRTSVGLLSPREN